MSGKLQRKIQRAEDEIVRLNEYIKESDKQINQMQEEINDKNKIIMALTKKVI